MRNSCFTFHLLEPFNTKENFQILHENEHMGARESRQSHLFYPRECLELEALCLNIGPDNGSLPVREVKSQLCRLAGHLLKSVQGA